MHSLLEKLILIAALMEIGMTLQEFGSCYLHRDCVRRIEKASRAVVKIQWKPISVFPEEAKRFR